MEIVNKNTHEVISNKTAIAVIKDMICEIHLEIIENGREDMLIQYHALEKALSLLEQQK